MSTATAEKLDNSVAKDELLDLDPRELRALARTGKWTGTTEGLATGYAQANLVIIPREAAFDFLLFCLRNPKPCPIVEVTDPGSPMITQVADNADLRTDLSRYSVYEKGELVAQPSDITEYWRDDLVGFLLGCSYSFETALLNANIPLRHQDEDKIVSIYTTDVQCAPAGRFSGPMVVSMRPIKHAQVVRAVQVTSRFPATHGAPVHIGDPSVIGVDLEKTGFQTDFVGPRDGEVPVFWGCGCTPQAVAINSKLDFIITHKAGHMFVTDTLSEEMAAL
ncbi:MAG: putative hydro-lyase [Rhodospirillales bacterium]|nr:putative hydro-lyase [Rhodospirillales bacterium]HJO73492.1 putative hydro-lyase [Rhodospirillales bacterium]